MRSIVLCRLALHCIAPHHTAVCHSLAERHLQERSKATPGEALPVSHRVQFSAKGTNNDWAPGVIVGHGVAPGVDHPSFIQE